MSVLDALAEIKKIEWIDAEGEPLDVSFLPGIGNERLDEIEATIGAPLPRDYRKLAQVCGGIESEGLEFDLERFEGDFWVEEILPHGMPFAHDGCGNFWVADCQEEREESAHLFYACHDPAVLVYQGTGLAGFLNAMPAYERGDDISPIRQVWESAVWDVWENNSDLVSQEQALLSSDPLLRAFAEEIGEPCHIADLRDVPIGAGFSWGRYGMDTRLRRFGQERIFAYGPPASIFDRRV